MALMLMCGVALGVSTVESYQIPALVDEINAALANPTQTTLTVTSGSTFPAHDIDVGELPAMTDGQLLVGTTSDSNVTVQTVSGDVAMDASGDFTIQATAVELSMLEASVTVSLDLADSSAQEDEVYGSSTAVNGSIGSGQLIVTNAITMLDVAGSGFSAYTLIRVWMTETLNGPTTTNNIEALVLSTGAAIATETANADYWYVTASGGTAIATITATASLTNYINIGVGPRVTSTEIIFVP